MPEVPDFRRLAAPFAGSGGPFVAEKAPEAA